MSIWTERRRLFRRSFYIGEASKTKVTAPFFIYLFFPYNLFSDDKFPYFLITSEHFLATTTQLLAN